MTKSHITHLAYAMHKKMGEIARGINASSAAKEEVIKLLELVVDMQIMIDILFNMNRD